MSVHRRADWCHECGQPWPCPTRRAEIEAATGRLLCGHVVARSQKRCVRTAVDGAYCAMHARITDAREVSR